MQELKRLLNERDDAMPNPITHISKARWVGPDYKLHLAALRALARSPDIEGAALRECESGVWSVRKRVLVPQENNPTYEDISYTEASTQPYVRHPFTADTDVSHCYYGTCVD